MRLLSVGEMKQIESAADSQGFSYEKMMLKAGNELARVVHKRYFSNESNHAVGLIGSGNNGGDTLIALSSLCTLGWTATAILLKPRTETDKPLQGLLENGGSVLDLSEKGAERRLKSIIEPSNVILDGVLGTGFHLPLSPEYAKLLSEIKKLLDDQTVVAVDCPSGVECDSGAASPEALDADLTVCMEAVKQGLVRMPGFLKCGEMVTVDLGITRAAKVELSLDRQVADDDLALGLIPSRPRDAHKGTFGTVMVIGGSINYTGAPVLAARAAYRVGAGLVQLAIPASLHPVIAGSIIEGIWLLLDEENGVIAESAAPVIKSHLEKITCMVVGPGIGRDETTARFIRALLMGAVEQHVKTMGFIREEKGAISTGAALPAWVIDADALRILSGVPEWWTHLASHGVLTPHPAEMAALTGLKVEEIQKDRENIALEHAKKWGQVVVLKGALSVIAEPGGRCVIIPAATSALAKAGTGDVLSGLIAGLIAQGAAPFDAAVAGAWLHAQAGIFAAEEVGSEASVMAGDLIEILPYVLG